MNNSRINSFLRGKVILVTGAGGSIGSAVSQAICAFEPSQLILLDYSESNLYEIGRKLVAPGDQSRVSSALGSVADADLLAELLNKYRPQVVYHAAAFKHVPLTELNPLAAVQNNAIATYVLAQACRHYAVRNLIMISTDKAVNPISVMGAAKRVAELALSHLGDPNTRMTAIRLGNVLSTNGSVVPLFLDQIRRGGPVTVTDPSVTRYFLKIEEAVELILLASEEDTNDIFIPTVKEAVNIHEMALELIKNSEGKAQNEIEVTFTGLRPGDKLSEEFLYSHERTEATSDPCLLRVASSADRSDSFEAGMELLSARIGARDVAGMVEALCLLVPEYQPSDTVLRLAQQLTAS